MVGRALYRALVALALAAPVMAQSHGAGISGQAFENAISANFIREHWGPPDSVRLIGAVLWRGSSEWQSNVNAAAGRARIDSARADAQRRGALAGGTITATADAWVEYDAATKTAIILNHSYSVAHADSTTVLMVDRVDHVGGEPIVSEVHLLCRKTARPNSVSGGTEAYIRAYRDMTVQWKSCLSSDPSVAAFLNRAPSR